MVSSIISRSKRACSVPPWPTSTIDRSRVADAARLVEAVVRVVDVRLLGGQVGVSGQALLRWSRNGPCYLQPGFRPADHTVVMVPVPVAARR